MSLPSCRARRGPRSSVRRSLGRWGRRRPAPSLYVRARLGGMGNRVVLLRPARRAVAGRCRGGESDCRRGVRATGKRRTAHFALPFGTQWKQGIAERRVGSRGARVARHAGNGGTETDRACGARPAATAVGSPGGASLAHATRMERTDGNPGRVAQAISPGNFFKRRNGMSFLTVPRGGRLPGPPQAGAPVEPAVGDPSREWGGSRSRGTHDGSRFPARAKVPDFWSISSGERHATI